MKDGNNLPYCQSSLFNTNVVLFHRQRHLLNKHKIMGSTPWKNLGIFDNNKTLPSLGPSDTPWQQCQWMEVWPSDMILLLHICLDVNLYSHLSPLSFSSSSNLMRSSNVVSSLGLIYVDWLWIILTPKILSSYCVTLPLLLVDQLFFRRKPEFTSSW